MKPKLFAGAAVIGLVVLTMSLGCGSSSSNNGPTGAGGAAGGKNLAKFEGVWSVVSGTTTITCPGSAADTTALSGNITWTAGTSSDLIQTSSDSSCIIHANAAGSTATNAGSQTCTISGADPTLGSYTAVISLTAYTFVVAADGQTATENGSGMVVYTFNATGQTITCTVNETAGSYQKQ